MNINKTVLIMITGINNLRHLNLSIKRSSYPLI